MTIKQLVEKYGYKTISIAMRSAARHLPGDAQHAGLFHTMLEMADDLEIAFQKYVLDHKK